MLQSWRNFRRAATLGSMLLATSNCSDTTSPLQTASPETNGGSTAAVMPATTSLTRSGAVASVTVTLDSSSLAPQHTTQGTAVARDAQGLVTTGTSIRWRSEDTTIAVVTQTGRVTAVKPGTVGIRCIIDGVIGGTRLTVASAVYRRVASMTVVLDSTSLVAPHQTRATGTIRDSNGNIQPGNIVWSTSDPSVATISSSGIVTAIAPGSLDVIGRNDTVTARAPLVVKSTSAPRPASQLDVATQPSATAQSGVAFVQQPVVLLRDDIGNPVSQSGVVITAAIATGGGALGGTVTATTNTNGVATFTNLSLSGTVGARTLSFSAPSLVSTYSAGISVSFGPASQVSITTQPAATAQSGLAFTRQPVLQLLDASGNAVQQAGVPTTASIASGSGTIGGTVTVNTDGNGVAAFTSLAITGTGAHTLSFSASGVTATSALITVGTAGATKLTITTQPSSSAQSGSIFAQQPVIQLRDGSGNAVAQAGVVVTAAVVTGGPALGGTTSVSTDAGGAARFTDLVITGTVGARTLQFSATSLTATTSGTISISAGAPTKLAILTQPSSTAASGSPFAQQPVIQLQDASSNVVAQTGYTVTAALASGTGILGGTTSATTNTNGVATFSALSITGSGAHTLRFSTPSMTSVSSGTITVSSTPPPPSGTCSNEPAGYARIQDQPWNVAPKSATGLRSMGWFNDDALDDFKLTIQSDPTAPFSSSSVIRGEFNAGDAGGSAPFSVRRSFVSGELYPKLYLCMYVKHDANFDNTNGNAGSKFFWPAGDAPGSFGSDTYTSHDGVNMDFALFQQNRVDRQLGQNVGPAGQARMVTRRGQWVRYEMLFVMNTANGAANGQFHAWIDGVKTHQYTDVDFNISAARAWQSLRWEPTYGGGTNPVPHDQYQYIDHLRISGSP